MSRGYTIASATGSAALSLTHVCHGSTQLISMFLHLSAAPTTSENLVLKLDSALGAAYDTNLISIDLAAGSTTDVFWQPEHSLRFVAGDTITLTYTNTNTGTFGASMYFDIGATE